MGITFKEVEENGLISDMVLEQIPRTCYMCGGDIEFTDSLKQIYCSNPDCKLKVAARLEYMAKKMGVDGWGESTCIAVVEHFNMKSPYQVFMLNDSLVCDGVAAFNIKVRDMLNSPKRKASLWEYVMYAGIPSIETTAYRIFGDYNTIDDAYKDIKKYQVSFVAEKLGIKNTESGVLAYRVYKTLLEYEAELRFGEQYFSIDELSGISYEVAITGGVSGYHNKGAFISMLNNRYSGKAHFSLMNTVTAKTDYLVVDGGTSSSKYNKAERLNESGKANISIVTSSDMLSELDAKFS